VPPVTKLQYIWNKRCFCLLERSFVKWFLDLTIRSWLAAWTCFSDSNARKALSTLSKSISKREPCKGQRGAGPLRKQDGRGQRENVCCWVRLGGAISSWKADRHRKCCRWNPRKCCARVGNVESEAREHARSQAQYWERRGVGTARTQNTDRHIEGTYLASHNGASQARKAAKEPTGLWRQGSRASRPCSEKPADLVLDDIVVTEKEETAQGERLSVGQRQKEKEEGMRCEFVL